eukprot:gnl/MRDRNA2_/MRDRNA2_80038_c0_seq1.p1 gnl/MRDRNA2_/MRDRNA2_80038_c0~~gnl/MRDRNA2_/MRDRNA2_80038_c0_seq1.p1  ORF type:complete len:553 (+),score=95.79 gnl/MRDRNA2_/MRDRNA2_80038_c0_seq1:146-1804(+)
MAEEEDSSAVGGTPKLKYVRGQTSKFEHEVLAQKKAVQVSRSKILAGRENAVANEAVLAFFAGSNLVDSGTFNGLIGLAIGANGIMMGIEVDMDLGFGSLVINWVFTSIWAIEMILRMGTYGPIKYFGDGWNRMDFCLAWLSIIDTWILPLAMGAEEGGGLRMLSILRILRVARVLRLIKVMKIFKELWLLFHGLFKALSVLIWVVVLLFMVIYIVALVMTTNIGHECGGGGFEVWDQCYELFGSMPRSMYTLFQVMTLESWSMAVARPVLEEKPYMVIVFIVFLYMTSFGLMNIVVGVIVEQTLESANDDAEKKAKEKLLQQEADIKILGRIFTEADEDGGGKVTDVEFIEACMRDDVQIIFEELQIPVNRPRLAKRVYDVLDADGSGEMWIDDLVNRCHQLKTEGQNLVKDQTMLLVDVRSLARNQRRLKEQLAKDSQIPSSPDGAMAGGGHTLGPNASVGISLPSPSKNAFDEGPAYATEKSVQDLADRIDALDKKFEKRLSAMLHQILSHISQNSQQQLQQAIPAITQVTTQNGKAHAMTGCCASKLG